MRWFYLLLIIAYRATAVDLAEEGERYEYPDKGFSIVPPVGFEVHENAGGVFLNFREPPRKGLSYQRNIQVFWNNDLRYIDEATAQEITEEIGAKFTKYNPHVQDYRVSKHQIIDVGEHKGILFYNQYRIDTSELQHIVLLVSSTKDHYLITYTDLLKNYEANEDNENYNNLWWNCFSSIGLSGKPPHRYQNYIIAGGAIGVFLLFCAPIYLFRRRRSASYYDSFADDSLGQGGTFEMPTSSSDEDGDDFVFDDDDDEDEDVKFA